jgi:hypothetical protein
VARRCRTGETVDAIEFQASQRLADIAVQKGEIGIASKVRDIVLDPGREIIQAPDSMAKRKKMFAKMRTYKACPA